MPNTLTPHERERYAVCNHKIQEAGESSALLPPEEFELLVKLVREQSPFDQKITDLIVSNMLKVRKERSGSN